MSINPYGWIGESLGTIHRVNWYRSVQEITGRPGAVVRIDGQEFINFASNDYLGLAGDNRLILAAIEATQRYGTGATGSRLITGHRPIHRELERAIAALKQTEDAIVFSSGYLANLGAVSALVGKRDLILADQYNHASLKNGAVLSGATGLEYEHGNVEGLKFLLDSHRNAYRRCLILTDTVFSMDGDLCPLPEVLELAETYGCMLLVDEAHGTGVLGETGAGAVEYFGCTGRELIQMGTLSKALGSLGGYVAGTAELIDFLRNRAGTWIYTTGLSPADTAAGLGAIAIVNQEPQIRAKLWQNVKYLKQLLAESVPSVASRLLPSESPILCLQVPDAQTVLAVGEGLKAAGILVGAVRPPTVPTSRIRVTVMATHEKAHCERLVEGLKSLLKF